MSPTKQIYPTYTLLSYPTEKKEYGNYSGSCPSRAAKKFLTFLSNQHKIANSKSKKALIFVIRKNNTMQEYKYVGTRVKLFKPNTIYVNNKAINFNFKNIVTPYEEYYTMKGGHPSHKLLGDKVSYLNQGVRDASKFDSHGLYTHTRQCHSIPPSKTHICSN
jgi:hypothetical protein